MHSINSVLNTVLNADRIQYSKIVKATRAHITLEQAQRMHTSCQELYSNYKRIK